MIEEYVRVVNKNTDLFSTCLPDDLLDTLVDFAEKKGFKYTVAKDKYKVKVEILEQDAGTVEISAKVSKVDKDKYVVEFNRVSGDSIVFFKHFNDIKEFYGELVNATY